MGIPDGEMKAQLDGDTKDGGDDAEPVFNPFTQPFILLTLIFIRPLRQRLLKSVPKFCRERISVIQPPPNAVKGSPEYEEWLHASSFVYMRTFCREYENFCLERDLKLEENRDNIQRELIRRSRVWSTRSSTARRTRRPRPSERVWGGGCRENGVL